MIRLYFICFCIYFCLTNPCIAKGSCKKITSDSSNYTQSEVRVLEKMIKPFISKLSIYNSTTVPNLHKLIEQFDAGKTNPDIYFNFTELVTKYGYSVEEHEVVTEDDYCLKMFRIPKPGAPVVYLQHGILCSADEFVSAGPKGGLAYALADAGYDVWLGNHRGNKYSRSHKEISPECAEFWDFSFDELGRYDLPVMIDYALNATGSSKLLYAGHSQGTTVFYVMCSERPEYNDKISVMVALASAAYMGNVKSPIFKLVAPFASRAEILTNIIGYYEFLPRSALVNAFTSTFCGTDKSAAIFCHFTIFLLTGFDFAQLDIKQLPVFYGHFPSGAAVRQAFHYFQEVVSGKFRRYDHGELKNLIKYKSINPPDYNVQNITCPIALFFSTNDLLTSSKDTEQFVRELPNLVEFYRVPCSSFNHFDYIWGKDANVLVNDKVIRVFEKYAEK